MTNYSVSLHRLFFNKIPNWTSSQFFLKSIRKFKISTIRNRSGFGLIDTKMKNHQSIIPMQRYNHHANIYKDVLLAIIYKNG